MHPASWKRAHLALVWFYVFVIEYALFRLLRLWNDQSAAGEWVMILLFVMISLAVWLFRATWKWITVNT